MNTLLRSFALCLCGLMITAVTGCTKSNPPATNTGTTTPTPSTAPASGKKRIVLLNNTDSPFWDAAREGIRQAEQDLKLAEAGYSAAMDSNTQAEEGQIEKLRQYGTQADIAAVIISPTSSTNPAIADELAKLKKKGIIIGCFDSDLNALGQPNREFYVGTNNVTGGKVLGIAAKAIKADAEYAQFVGMDSQQNAIERMDGFTEVYGAQLQKDRRLDDTDRTRAKDNVRDVIAKYPNLSMLVGIWSYNAPAIVDVVREKGLRDKFKVVVFDAEALAIEEMAKGQIDVMVVQNPLKMGYDSVKYAFAKATNKPEMIKELYPNLGNPGGDIRDTGLKVVVPDEGSPVTQEMFSEFGDSVKLMKFSEFQAWLKQNNLTSS